MGDGMGRGGNFLPRLDQDPYAGGEVDRNVVTITAPASVAADQFRTLYFRIERLKQVRPLKLVTITSAVPGEGKTVTAVNLALTAARTCLERRVLLVDADLRRGRVAELLGIRRSPGLKELLEDEVEVKDVVRRFQGERLAVVACGTGSAEPTGTLASPAMRKFLERACSHFDEVYVDAPPALPFADAAILGALSDGVLLVIRASQTAVRHVRQAVETLAGAPIVGCVLNGMELVDAGYRGWKDPRSG